MNASPTPRIPRPLRSACPVALRAYLAYKQAGALAAIMRRLRRDLTRCEACPLHPRRAAGRPCVVAAHLNSAIHQALQEINEEWDLAAAHAPQE